MMVTHRDTLKLEQEVVHPLISSVIRGDYRFEEINERFAFNLNKVNKLNAGGCQLRYNHQPSPALMGGTGRITLMTSGYEGNIGVIGINISDLDFFLYEELHVSFPDHADAVFENKVVTALLHESDHLELGVPMSDNLCSIMNIEQQVWANTCEFTLCPLIEKYGQIVSHLDMDMYEAWVKGGKKRTSDTWRSFIRRMYRGQ